MTIGEPQQDDDQTDKKMMYMFERELANCAYFFSWFARFQA